MDHNGMGNLSPSQPPRILLYLLRNDLRLSDNPIFHDASRVAIKQRKAVSAPHIVSPPICNSTPQSKLRRSSENLEPDAPSFAQYVGATHLLPVYIFPANHIEVSGFLKPSANERSPYPEARSRVGGFWRTGPRRTDFLAESLWDLKERLEAIDGGSGLILRVGAVKDVVEDILSWFGGDESGDHQGSSRGDVVGVCLTGLEGTEEKADERNVRTATERWDIPFKSWKDEKYFVDDDDLPFNDTADLPNVYTTHRKTLEPLRDRPRQTLPTPTRLPPLPKAIPPQQEPFEIPTTLEGLKDHLRRPLEADPSYGLPAPPRWPRDVSTAHPFSGGESAGQDRVSHLISNGSMSAYKETRNGMLGLDFSTKLSAYLAFGCLTARQIHWRLVDFEEGRGEDGKDALRYGKGENEGTAAVRFELLWRDYMRLCARKFGSRMFHEDGVQASFSGRRDSCADEKASAEAQTNGSIHRQAQPRPKKRWRYIDRSSGTGDNPTNTHETLLRFLSGTTGIGLIDASQRELFLTGYTSNRARQNVASFLSAHLGIDWRLGAEWYECWLIDYDMPNNWGNWEYVAGVGNDPRQGRVFNPVKQALDYDARGEYVRAWVPELRGVDIRGKGGKGGKGEVDQEKLMGVFQAWRLGEEEKRRLGLKGLVWVENPLIRIPFSVGRKGVDANSRGRGRGRGRGGFRGRGKGRDTRRLGQEEKAGNVMNGGDV